MIDSHSAKYHPVILFVLQELSGQNSNDSSNGPACPGTPNSQGMRPTPSPTGSTGSRSMSPAVGRSFLRLSLFHLHLYLVTKLVIADWLVQDVPELRRHCFGSKSFDKFLIC